MFTVALIGGDGAGKTSLARVLEKRRHLHAKYLYMGLSAQSSNVALPTSRLLLLLKQRAYRNKVRQSGDRPAPHIPARDLEYGRGERSGWWVAVRFLNRLAEAWYRQMVSLRYRMQGYVVVYDRHVLFDAAILVAESRPGNEQRLDRLYFWLLTHLYPKPDLTLFLDAPAEVLYARKGETTPRRLAKQRQILSHQGRSVANFVRIDAAQAPEQVLEEVTRHILEFQATASHRHAGAARA